MFATALAFAPSRMMEKIGSMKTALERIDLEMKMHHHNVRNYKPNLTFALERTNFTVKLAENGADLEQCLKLRFEVFHREYMNKKRTVGIDVDKLDYICDHLMIVDKRTSKVIGTYRLNCSKFGSYFYSTSEFQLDKLLELDGTKLEMGRACIDKDHRNGVVIALLWKGLSEYIQRTGTDYLFGCSSIKTMEPLEIGLITHHLMESGHLVRDYGIAPTRKYKVRQLARALEYIETNPYEYNKKEVSAMIPALLNSYLKAGAKIHGEPAIDREFHCIDFMTVLKMTDMSSQIKGKYNL